MTRFPEATEGLRSIPIVLASGSPRRRELVERLGYDPEVVTSNIHEQISEGESAEAYTARLAAEKAEDVADRLPGGGGYPSWMLSGDTVVALEGRVLEKPRDPEHAVEMLRSMVGRWHQVVTSFCWFDRRAERSRVGTVVTDVRMRRLSDEFLERYVATGEPLDKAGAYGIQEFGSLLVRELRGSYFNVVGLPVCEVVEAVESMDALELHPFAVEQR